MLHYQKSNLIVGFDHQDIVTRHLTEKSVADEQASSLGPAVWATGSQSELTPSESLATSDNVKYLLHHLMFSFFKLSNKLTFFPPLFFPLDISRMRLRRL